MKRNSTLKRGNGFKKVVGNSLKKTSKLKKSSFKRTLSDIQKQVKEADSKFSKHIINRDKKCLRCGTTKMLTCSHFHGRANYATRFEPLNCVTFCIDCHAYMESKKSGEYMDWMIDWLGEDQFFVLGKISNMDIGKVESLILANNLFKKVDINSDIQY